ncbi:hypothetical protein LWP59_18240 [Amycolatopsis acidiphila]|uniref:hypothetical protein n=1 Tax=Amycolatopsis acidiphila TaxID=715473 RepID=UPI00174913EA|nr:hypothetical protein [Amycolatopsis acidiphila]UIJ63435.1 hypothetical protein LWP59_18240 [Amycolatopsis acidiphila]GHH00353.1 hypothetical protein GCM10017788_80560 [Amycolatopsis acidiphila]
MLGADAAAGNLVGAAPEDDRTTVAAVVRQVFGKDLAPLALGGLSNERLWPECGGSAGWR